MNSYRFRYQHDLAMDIPLKYQKIKKKCKVN